MRQDRHGLPDELRLRNAGRAGVAAHGVAGSWGLGPRIPGHDKEIAMIIVILVDRAFAKRLLVRLARMGQPALQAVVSYLKRLTVS